MPDCFPRGASGKEAGQGLAGGRGWGGAVRVMNEAITTGLTGGGKGAQGPHHVCLSCLDARPFLLGHLLRRSTHGFLYLALYIFICFFHPYLQR